MQSSLTRSVFRAIIANKPYCNTTCSRKLPRWRSRALTAPTVPSPPCRSLFGLSIQPPTGTALNSKSTFSNAERAADVLVGLVRAQRDQTRLPPVNEIAQALNTILQYRNEARTRLSRSDIYLLTEGFSYIQEHKPNDETDTDSQAPLTEVDLQQGLSALASSLGKDKFRSDAKALAFMLFSELRRRTGAPGDAAEVPILPDSVGTETYITVLSSTGGAREAWDTLKKSSDGDVQKNWLEVIKGLHNEGLGKDVWKAFDEMRARTGDLSVDAHELLTIYFAKNADLNTTKKVYEQTVLENGLPSVEAQVEMARFCIRNNDLNWAEPILTNLRAISHDPRVWDVILVSSAAQGVDANGIAALMSSLAETAAENDIPGPTISNVNALIEYAFSVGNIEAVRNYKTLAQQQGLQTNVKTLLLQLDYEVKIGDLDKAASTYDIISSEDPIEDESDVPILNKFLQALCFSPIPNYEFVTRTADSLLGRDVYLDAETISGLCKVYLHHDNLEDILGLLKHRVDLYPRNDRARISQSFKKFITDERVADQRAFNAYELFGAAFPETPVHDRLPIMHSFFRRKRPDLACLVFGHMRQREDPTARPTPEAYGQCFEGIANCQDVDGLQMVYNMLKLDLLVEPATRVRNGLMAAYIACGQPYTAVIDHFWKIMTSLEGPTMSSFALALRACETWIPQGAVEARRIIAMMQSWDLEITKEIYDCYIGAIAGQSEFENTIELIEEMENDIGVPPDTLT